MGQSITVSNATSVPGTIAIAVLGNQYTLAQSQTVQIPITNATTLSIWMCVTNCNWVNFNVYPNQAYKVVDSGPQWGMTLVQLSNNPNFPYQTGFETNQGFNTSSFLGGQAGWLNSWDNGNGIVNDFFPGKGQQAYLGYNPPISSNQYGNYVWYPLNLTNFIANQPIQFSTTMAIEDSSNGYYDWFYWNVYDTAGNQSLSLAFGNTSMTIWSVSGTNDWVLTPLTFTNGIQYQLVIQLDYAQNKWSATLGGLVLATNQPIGSPGQLRDLWTIAAGWDYTDQAHPGDNYLLFDDYKVVSLAMPPVITGQPQSQSAIVGTNLSFTVTATGTALAYQWRLNGTNLTNDVRISGVQTNVLNIAGVLMSDAGNYSVAISNGGGSTNSPPATLAVLKASPVLTWTNPAAINYGTALSSNQLNAKASLPGGFAYVPASGAILNAGTNLLSVAFTPTDTVNYNSATGSVSLAVQRMPLSVTASNATRGYGAANPVFGGIISGLVNADNITASYACSAVTASPAGSYPIVPSLIDPNSRQGNYLVSLVNGTLTITNAVSNTLSIITQPQSQTVGYLSNATFTVTATGTAPLTYQWFFNGTNIIGANATNLIVPNVSPTNTGNYLVVVSNISGSLTSQVASLSLPILNLYNSFNQDATLSNPTSDPVFQLSKRTLITSIYNYHYNSGSGATPGTIGLKQIITGVSTNVIGQWPAVGFTAYGGVVNGSWYAYPNIILAPGTYLVTDSSHATWSYTTTAYFGAGGSNWAPGLAFSEIEGVLLSATNLPTPPTITTNPVTQVVNVGANASFTVAVTGSMPLSYQWYFNNSIINGAVGSSYNLNSAGATNVGQYTVTVWNSSGTNTSAAASLWLTATKKYAGVNINGPVGGACLVQYITNLTYSAAWVPIQSATIVSNPTVIIDYGSPDKPQRYYSIVPQ